MSQLKLETVQAAEATSDLSAYSSVDLDHDDQTSSPSVEYSRNLGYPGHGC